MQIILKQIPYEEFRRFYQIKHESEQEVRNLYIEYSTRKNPVMMNDHETKEYAEHQEKLEKARKRTYKFSGLVLSDVYISSFKVDHDGMFQLIDGHAVPVAVNLEIGYGI